MNLPYVSGTSNGGSLSTQRWDGEGYRREGLKGGNICIPVADSF